MSDTTRYAERLARVQAQMQSERVPLLILAPTSQMRYLTGWAESGHERLLALFVPAFGEPVFVVPEINAEQARRNAAGLGDVRGWDDTAGWRQTVEDLLADKPMPAGAVAVDDELMSVHLLRLQDLVRDRPFVAAGPLMARLRSVKAADELACLERSAKVTDDVYEECLSVLREGMTEREMRQAIERAYAARGTAPDFAIIGFGSNSALPHHSSGDTRLRTGDIVLVDIGCTIEEYCSDITRTVAFGSPPDEARRVYDVVYRAHRAALEASRPGVACEDVDAAARRVVADAGYGPQFMHRTGHGIGLSGHEDPNIVAGNAQLLEPGMCFSDEPGIYLTGRFGVRIENIVTVTADGARYLNAEPPAQLVCVPVA